MATSSGSLELTNPHTLNVNTCYHYWMLNTQSPSYVAHKHSISYNAYIWCEFRHAKWAIGQFHGAFTLHWRHNDHCSVSNHQLHDCLLNRLIKENINAPSHRPLCGEFTGTGEFSAQRVSNAENGSIWWRHHDVPRYLSTSDRPGRCFIALVGLLRWVFAILLFREWYVHGHGSAIKFVLEIRWRLCITDAETSSYFYHKLPQDEEWNFHPRKWNTTKIHSGSSPRPPKHPLVFFRMHDSSHYIIQLFMSICRVHFPCA